MSFLGHTFKLPRARVALSLALFGVLVSVAAAQTRGWLWQNPLPQGNAIHALRFAADKQHGWAIGSDGAILRTEDGGYEWEAQRAPVQTTLYGLFVKDKNTALAVGARGVVLTTENGGERWTLRPTDVRDHLYNVAFAGDDARHGWACGTYGRIIATTDGGRTWREQVS